jgi:hypothetical protein
VLIDRQNVMGDGKFGRAPGGQAETQGMPTSQYFLQQP